MSGCKFYVEFIVFVESYVWYVVVMEKYCGFSLLYDMW